MNTLSMTSRLTPGMQVPAGSASTVSLRPGVSAAAPAQNSFGSVFEALLAGVNQSQQYSTQLAEAFERGQHQDLAGVMIAQQKAGLSFQATLQTRNKLISAYQDIMNMPI